MEGKTIISDKRAVEAIYPLPSNEKSELTPPRAQSGVTRTEYDGNSREEKEVDCNKWRWRSYREEDSKLKSSKTNEITDGECTAS
jgi:hypothetical protein